MKMGPLDKLSYTLLVIGGLNWGLVGFFQYNLVSSVFSSGLARVIYALVGLAGLYGVYTILSMMMSESKKAS